MADREKVEMVSPIIAGGGLGLEDWNTTEW